MCLIEFFSTASIMTHSIKVKVSYIHKNSDFSQLQQGHKLQLLSPKFPQTLQFTIQVYCHPENINFT